MTKSLAWRLRAFTVRALKAQGVENEVVLSWLDEVLDDPRWTQVELAYARGDATLERLAALGPRHAKLLKRFRSNVSRPLFESIDGLGKERFFEMHEAVLAVAASGESDQDESNKNRWRRQLGLLMEGAGLEQAAYRRRLVHWRRAIGAFTPQLWAAIGSGQPPTLKYNDGFSIPGAEAEPGALRALASFRHEHGSGAEIQIHLGSVVSAMLVAEHRMPDMAGLDPAALLLWDPCAGYSQPKAPGQILGHELVHALSDQPQSEPWDPQGQHARYRSQTLRQAELLRQIGYPGDPVPSWLHRVGTQLVLHYPNGQRGLICPTLHDLNEALTESATRDLLDRVIPLDSSGLLFATLAHHWPSNDRPAVAGGYDMGVELYRRLFHRPALEVLTANDPITELSSMFEAIVRPESWPQVSDWLFDQSQDLCDRPEAQAMDLDLVETTYTAFGRLVMASLRPEVASGIAQVSVVASPELP